MDAPQLLLFDLGGVLLENKAFSRLQRLIPDSGDAKSLRSRWLVSPSVRRFELGRISPDEFAACFIEEWGLSTGLTEFLDEFASWPTGFYPCARDILQRLRSSYRVGCLSNSNEVHWGRFDGFKDEFDIALSSHLLGAIKPDPDAFLKALSICQVDAAAVCFFDDAEENVRAAASLGIRSYHVEGVKALTDLLYKEKIL